MPLGSQITIQKTVYKVSDFLGWQRDGSLVLSPSFQRRPVWRPTAKSFLIDTIVRGFPVPVIFIRDRVDLDRQRTTREVVDGQQRLRTVLSFVDGASIADYDTERDEFTVRAIHNSDIADRPYARLPPDAKAAILGYEFSTHILGSDTDDRDILQMFSRINSTGTKLSPQELRNAQYFGACKTLMYQLAFAQLNRWRSWGVFTEDQIARMKEVEMTSDLVINFLQGIAAKRQPAIDRFYDDMDDEFQEGEEVGRRFQRVFDEIDDRIGNDLRPTVFSSEGLFFSLALAIYDALFGLGSTATSTRRPGHLPNTLRDDVIDASVSIRNEEVSADLLDAIRRAPVDAGRRQVRHEFLLHALDLTSRS